MLIFAASRMTTVVLEELGPDQVAKCLQFIKDNIVLSFEEIQELSTRSILAGMASSNSSRLKKAEIADLWTKLRNVYEENKKGFYLQVYSLANIPTTEFSTDEKLLKGPTAIDWFIQSSYP